MCLADFLSIGCVFGETVCLASLCVWRWASFGLEQPCIWIHPAARGLQHPFPQPPAWNSPRKEDPKSTEPSSTKWQTKWYFAQADAGGKSRKSLAFSCLHYMAVARLQ